MERFGSDHRIGEPVAFIETAWRRYTKHSRNKAQEIQGAILPLVTTHKNFAPFIGVVLGGEFTDGAVKQLVSLGFSVLHFSYNQIIAAFQKAEIDANFEENTPIGDFLGKISAWEVLSQEQKKLIAEDLFNKSRYQVSLFFQDLEKSVTRFISRINVIPLHGKHVELRSVPDAIMFISEYSGEFTLPVSRYEISIQYNNGDKIDGVFQTKDSAIEFLESYQSPKPEL